MPDLQDRLKQLNEPQRKAVTHGEGPLLVLAGPGSGKTTVIVERIRYLLDAMHVPPEQILVITFTKDAARSMQQRFQRQSDLVYPVSFGTFHSVFYHILMQSSRPQAPFQRQILTDAQKKNIMIPLLRQLRQREQGHADAASELSSDAALVLAAISFYKNTGHEEQAVQMLPVQWQAYFHEIMERYREQTAKRGAVDFDDMLFECRKMLEEDDKIRGYWQARFRHILIDEFQDINPIQYQVIRLLAGKPYNLFAVGDDDQAIYGFRGSDPACLRQFAEDFGAERVLLDLNYRSCPAIVDAAGKVIEQNDNRFAKRLRAASGKAVSEDGACGEGVRIVSFAEREQQNAYLRARIEEFQKMRPGERCAVLFRTNTFMQSFGASLAKAGIPYVMREKAQNLYEHFIALDIMAYLRFAAGERSRALFLRMMNKPVRYLRRDALAETETVDFGRLKQWYREWGGAHALEYLETLDILQTQLKAISGMSPRLAVRYVCKAVGYERWLREQARVAGGDRLTEWLEILDWLKEDSSGYDSVKEWMEAQRSSEEPAAGKTRTDMEQKDGAVQLMTVHAAKGLEFDKVWIPECNERNFPHGRMPDQQAVEEERRVFYVAMTRAKISLELLCLTGTDERPRLISRFLNPLLKYYSSSDPSMISSNSQLSRYSSKASVTFSYSSSSSM